MFFTSEHLVNSSCKVDIKPGYRTDHSAVTLTIVIVNERRGPGLWKFNDSLLEDDCYSNLVKSVIVDTLKQYAVPGYTDDFISNPQNFADIQLAISMKLFYETLLMMIRGETIRYSKRKARNFQAEEEVAIANINRLREKFSQTGEEADAKQLVEAQNILEKIREPKVMGLITRSRVRWYDEGEKCSKYFLSLEKSNSMRKSVSFLQVNGEVLSEKKEIIHVFSKHYADKYGEREEASESGIDEYLRRNIKKTLCEEQKRKLDEPISTGELKEALMAMKKGKSPGSNGFTASFFKHFWDYLGSFLFRSFQQSTEEGSLSVTQREAIITLIPKTGRSPDTVGGWRPISLFNID